MKLYYLSFFSLLLNIFCLTSNIVHAVDSITSFSGLSLDAEVPKKKKTQLLFDFPPNSSKATMTEWLTPKDMAYLNAACSNYKNKKYLDNIQDWEKFFFASPVVFPREIRNDPDKRKNFLEWVIRHAPKIKEINLSGSNITDDELIQLAARLVNIESLDFSGCREITDIGLLCLNELPKLRKLNIYFNTSWCQLNVNAGLMYLSKLIELRYLDLSGCENFRDGRSACLSGLKQLQVLILPPEEKDRPYREEWYDHDEGFQGLSKLKELRALKFPDSYCCITAISLMNLVKKLPKLEEFCIPNKYKREDLKKLFDSNKIYNKKDGFFH
jgi:hypothetical protein